MTEQINFDKHPRLPYSIGTGIPKHGDAEIEGYLQSLRIQGFCVIERVIPEGEVTVARDNLLKGRELERRKRIQLEHQRNPEAEIDDSFKRLDHWRADPVRPPLPPQAEICDIARCEVFAEYLAAPRVLKWLGRSLTRTSALCRPKLISRRGRQKSRSPKNNYGGAAGIRTGRTI